MSRRELHPRAGYEQIRLYAPGPEREFTIDLSDNTNRWGMPPEAMAALRDATSNALTRYPSLYGGRLKALLADYCGVTPDMIVTGTGSDGVLEPAIRAFGEPGDRLAHPDPTFVMIGAFARMNGLIPAPVPLRPDYDVDAPGMLAAGARIVYLCSPNNPTGGALSPNSVGRIVGETTGLVIVDEAYAEFAAADALDLVRANGHVLVTRTLSKAFGLAGLRIGYGIAAPAVASAIEKARGPYAVSAAAEAAAAAALGPGRAWVEARAREAVGVRERFASALRRLGLEPAPSDANFLFVPVRGAIGLAARLSERGIAVRAFGGLSPVSDALRTSGGEALRINVAPWPTMEQVLDALQQELHDD